MTTDDGDMHKVIGFANGKEDRDGHIDYTYFTISRNAEMDENLSVKDNLKAHKKDVRLLEPIAGHRFGILFFTGVIEDWDDL